MRTTEFKTVITDYSVEKCLNYSDNPEELKVLLNSLDVQIKFTGYRTYFEDDKKERLTGIFKIIRNKGITIEFNLVAQIIFVPRILANGVL
jgi:hypothetical protein